MESIEWTKVPLEKISTFECEYISQYCKYVITSFYENENKIYKFKGFFNRNINGKLLRYEVEPSIGFDDYESCRQIAEHLIRSEEAFNESR